MNKVQISIIKFNNAQATYDQLSDLFTQLEAPKPPTVARYREQLRLLLEKKQSAFRDIKREVSPMIKDDYTIEQISKLTSPQDLKAQAVIQTFLETHLSSLQ